MNNETKAVKYYGSESKYLEFKTSLVFPAHAPGEEAREDPQAQIFHILSRIAGLLNANGGRLYLGVNNDGYEVGMHDDFRYYERHQMYAGKYSYKISSLDNLTVYLEEVINQNFGRQLARKIEVSVDEEATKDVIMFNIEQSLEPVFLDGRLFVRQSGQATYEYYGKDVEVFVKERELLIAERDRKLEIKKKAAVELPPQPVKTIPEPKKIVVDSEPQPQPTVEEPVGLATSLWRPNVLHEYETGYTEPLGYLYFTKEKQVWFSAVDVYAETDPDCCLALVIPHELTDGYLVLGYQGEKALKISLQDIMTQTENSRQRLPLEDELMFAAVAGRDDGLLCAASDSKGSLSRRLTPLAQIEQGRFNSLPKRIHEASMSHTVAYEIITGNSLETYSDCLADKMAARRFGMVMKINEGEPNFKNKLNELLTKCAPAL